MTAKKSWIISVKLGVGCYRHLQIAKDASLSELADLILTAFEFENDHLHAFFMDNKAWSQMDEYVCAYADMGGFSRHTEDYQLTVLELRQSFKFVFDFGDDWQFQCKVLRESEDTDSKIVKSVGESYQQYPSYEDDWIL